MIVGQQNNYVNSKEVKKGELLKILDEGRVEISDKYTYDDGNPKKSYVFSVEKDGKAQDMRINGTSIKYISNGITEEDGFDEITNGYGNDTSKWVGKYVKAHPELDRKINATVVYLTPTKETPESQGDGWEE